MYGCSNTWTTAPSVTSTEDPSAWASTAADCRLPVRVLVLLLSVFLTVSVISLLLAIGRVVSGLRPPPAAFKASGVLLLLSDLGFECDTAGFRFKKKKKKLESGETGLRMLYYLGLEELVRVVHLYDRGIFRF